MNTDWLASESIFYNTKTNKVSKNINDVIDFESFDWHLEGLYNYLDFGYSVLEQTPIKNVKMLRHSSEISHDENGKIKIIYHDDPAEKWIGITSNEDDVFQKLHTKINKWENSTQGEIIVPTSGGYDSRLLNFLIEDKSRIRAFTYGISDDQNQSHEVVFAKKLSEILGIQWEMIPIGFFNTYIDQWNELYSASTHAHGMYHLEFYDKILKKVGGGNPFLSGIIGDAWAGSINIGTEISSNNLSILGYSHGANADPSQMANTNIKFDLRDEYITSKNVKLNESFWTTIESMRFKIVLLNYLMRTPKLFGFETFTPFLDIDIALSMLTLPKERRKNRIWQKEYFQKNKINIEEMNLKSSGRNTLNFIANKKVPLKPLSPQLLSSVVNPTYVDWINKSLAKARSLKSNIYSKLSKYQHTRYIWRLMPRDPFIHKAHSAYLTLYPLQKIIEQKNEYFKN